MRTPNLSEYHSGHADQVHNGYCYKCQEWIDLTVKEIAERDAEYRRVTEQNTWNDNFEENYG